MEEHTQRQHVFTTTQLFRVVLHPKVAEWQNEHLPSDQISIENGGIITQCQRWPLMIDRFTSRRRAAISRKLVAVGTARLASMFVTMRAAAPLSGSPSGSTFAAATGAATGAGVGTAPFDGAGAAGEGVTAAVVTEAGTAVAGAAVLFVAAALPFEGLPFEGLPFDVVVPFALLATSAATLSPPNCDGSTRAKKSCHVSSTEFGSSRNCVYISRASQALGPHSEGSGDALAPELVKVIAMSVRIDPVRCLLNAKGGGLLRCWRPITFPAS